MSDTRRERWRLPSVKFGECATAALLIAVASGVVLAIPYDPADALTSVAAMALANPAAAFFRNLHYWSAQALLVLTLLHAWDHVRRREPRPLRFGVWLRICLTLPVLGLAAWSGFVLKGDLDGLQALRVVATTVADLPLVGPLLVSALFGRDESLHLVHIHHAATFTIALWLVLIEHGRLLWPRPVATLAVLVPATLLSLWVSPALHDGLSAVVKGPWYFVGLQEAFHWSPWPGLVVAVGVLPLLALIGMRWLGPRGKRATACGLLAATALYAALSVVGWAFRGADWEWTEVWSDGPRSLVVASVFAIPDPDAGPLRGRSVPMVMGRPEGCLVCHANVTGLSESHAPETIGCAACHLGNVFSLDAPTAHAGMVVVPGNLADVRRTCSGACHGTIAGRVERSLMTSNAGLVAVNRAAWDESHEDRGGAHIARVGFSPADTHFRQLCASCHLGLAKDEPWPIDEYPRGGGCTACHLTYSAGAFAALERYRAHGRTPGRKPPSIHPDITLPSDNTPCFGCHSRSGRISLAYEGWHEVDHELPDGSFPVRRRLDDGRTVVKVTPDVHASSGMLCVDCHTTREVMGDGIAHARQADQPHVACEDCHSTGRPPTIEASRAPEDGRRIARLRGLATGGRRLVLASSGDPFVNVHRDDDGTVKLLRRSDRGALESRPPRPECGDAVHGRVSCIGCHTRWAPRCPTCHTAFDPAGASYDSIADGPTVGEWIESGSGFTAVPPTLGIRMVGGEASAREVFEPFIPGMIATLDSSGAPGGASSRLFRRWYARVFPHTVTRAGRSCQSCHTDPVALGFGEGRLELVARGDRQGEWRFTPAHPRAPDGLPADAWTGFLQTRTGTFSSRDDVRPLAPGEQRRVLAVGACLTCHTSESDVMRASVEGFERVVERMSGSCLRATW
jgi:hypothetical protein